jgi:hypothetical protein
MARRLGTSRPGFPCFSSTAIHSPLFTVHLLAVRAENSAIRLQLDLSYTFHRSTFEYLEFNDTRISMRSHQFFGLFSRPFVTNYMRSADCRLPGLDAVRAFSRVKERYLNKSLVSAEQDAWIGFTRYFWGKMFG